MLGHLSDKRLKPGHLKVLDYVYWRSRANNDVLALSQDEIAKAVGLSSRRVIDILADLESWGYFKRERYGRRQSTRIVGLLARAEKRWGPSVNWTTKHADKHADKSSSRPKTEKTKQQQVIEPTTDPRWGMVNGTGPLVRLDTEGDDDNRPER
jgi:hypothetical protein